MFRSLRVGRAFGIPVYLHPTLLLLPLWAWWLNRDAESYAAIGLAQAVLAAVFFCVLLHEFGHALMARHFGIGTRDITLYPIGGVARLEGAGDHPAEEICIALAGPAVNLGIVLLTAPVVALGLVGGSFGAGGSPVFGFVLAVMLGNFVLMLFNLVPAFPMDGGRVFRATLALFVDPLTATAAAAYLGIAIAGGLGLLGVYLGNPSLVLVSLFVAVAGQMELRMMRYYRRRREAEERLAAYAEPAPR